jgi:hypothetical protein
MQIAEPSKRKWLHVAIIILGLPIAVLLGSVSIRVFHWQYVGPILLVCWFVYGAWFLLARGIYRP